MEPVMLTLAEEFLERGIETDIVLMQRKGERTDNVPSRARVFDLEAHHVVMAPTALAQYLRRQRPSVLLSAGYTNRIALLARLLAGTSTSIVISEHSMLTIPSSESILPNWVLDQLTKWTYPLADRMIAVSEGVAEEFSQSLDFSRENFDVIYNPVIGPETPKLAGQIVEHPWFSDKSTPVVLGVGRLVEQKNFLTLLRAFERVRESRKSRLVILGEGKRRPALEKEAKKLGLRSQIWMPGFVSNPLKYMSDASLFVLSSKWGEGLGNVLIEAMACGTPVVSTNCPGGPTEILENGEHGRLVPAENSTALAAAVEDALDGLVPPAPPSAVDRFRRDTVAEQYLDVLSSAM